MEEERMEEEKKENPKRKEKKKSGKRTTAFLHILQHGVFTGTVIAAAFLLLGSFVVVDGRAGTVTYHMDAERTGTAFEDSEIFNKLLGSSVSDIICYGAIRAQMETNGQFDPEKEIDVTAFANRYKGMEKEYITAKYYLEDLLKWYGNGFTEDNEFLTGEEADSFLSRSRTVTKVNLQENENAGYLNSDFSSQTTVEDVSGNLISDGDNAIRDDVEATILNNRYKTVDGKNIEDYVSSWEEYYTLCNNVKRAAEDLWINYQEYLSYQDYYSGDNTNVVYFVRRTVGKKTTVFSNEEVKETSVSALESRLKEECDKYIIYDAGNLTYDTNTKIEESTVRYILSGYEYAYPEDSQVFIGVRTSYAAADAFSEAKNSYMQYSPYLGEYLLAVAAGVLIYLLLLVVLTVREGKRELPEDKIPTEIMLLLMAAAVLLLYAGFQAIKLIGLTRIAYYNMSIAVTGISALIVSILFSFFYYSAVRRWKAHTFWKNSILRRLCHGMAGLFMYLYDNSAAVLRILVPSLVLLFLNLFLSVMTAVCLDTSREIVFVVFLLITLLADGLAIVFLYKSAMDRQHILDGIQKINAGDTGHKIDTASLHGDNLVLANEINGIGEGIRNAVDISMKDERLKADLITNVSHDIKTPLTSIINYVDLIKRENVENPNVREYIEVLDNKSQRLKQLTDDLVEASKISSGNIVLQWERINLIELLNQTRGEFSEKFEQKGLTPVIRAEKSSVLIEADSRRIWRVMENLFNNICKYALQGTRVYIDVTEKYGENGNGSSRVVLSIKNISENPIKVNADELTERFIRGDESRTTEGSGLGLSIARNLTEAMKGQFEITVDGDLFKVTLTFPLLEEQTLS